jgi:hypothetical protein
MGWGQWFRTAAPPDPAADLCPSDQVRANLIVIRRKNLPQVRFAKDQHPVQALAADIANQASRNSPPP